LTVVSGGSSSSGGLNKDTRRCFLRCLQVFNSSSLRLRLKHSFYTLWLLFLQGNKQLANILKLTPFLTSIWISYQNIKHYWLSSVHSQFFDWLRLCFHPECNHGFDFVAQVGSSRRRFFDLQKLKLSKCLSLSHTQPQEHDQQHP